MMNALRLVILVKSRAPAPSKDTLLEFFKKHPHPKDTEVHKFAEERGISPHVVESAIYSLLSDLVTPETKDRPWQIDRGIEVEAEHLDTIRKIKSFHEKRGKFPPDKVIQRWIAEDHVKEGPYYSFLDVMEAIMKKMTGGAGG
jgi:hypothetical protein